MCLSIGKYVKYKLNELTSVKEINPLLFPVDQKNLYIVYIRKYVTPEYTRDGISFNLTGVEINIESVNYMETIEIAEKVRELFECKSGTFENIQIHNCELTSATESTDGNVFTQTLNFEFTTN